MKIISGLYEHRIVVLGFFVATLTIFIFGTIIAQDPWKRVTLRAIVSGVAAAVGIYFGLSISDRW